MITGAGMMNDQMESVMGAVLVYTSDNLTCSECWKYKGMINGTYPDYIMWECPWMIDISPGDSTPYTQVLGFGADKWNWVHPNDPEAKAGYKPTIAWVGNFDKETYKMSLSEHGPQLVDLGDALYVPNIVGNIEDRRILLGWVHGCSHGLDSCPNGKTWKGVGSQTTPRELSVIGEPLFQQPIQEMDDLRLDTIASFDQDLDPVDMYTVLEGQHYFLDFVMTFKRMQSQGFVIMISRPIASQLTDTMTISYDWDSSNLWVFFGSTTAPNPDYPPLPTPQLLPGDIVKMGGRLNFMDADSQELSLRIFSDGSHWEMFTSTGQTIVTRWYHDMDAFAGQVFEIASVGGNAYASGAAYNMDTIYTDDPWNDNTKPEFLVQ
eukprot:TRINITY_DN6229_c1_g2_i5.p1 TRINITY_DN6229_c1_g2~~TRINITY_DN6229_c1_g2_i5.p1  ORF type:complete len:377 (+),score=51.97 TRINITY_DN6229_c1_g2_i5:44-1174(+)